MSRLDQLLKFLEEEPGDPFNIYAVALEYQKVDAQKAQRFYELLLQDHEDYVPAYYHFGKLKQELGEAEAAKDIFQKGILQAEKCKDLKAARELRNALTELEFD